MSKPMIKKILSIDTLFRDSYESTSSTNYQYLLKNPIANVTSVKLSSMELPNTWHEFSSKNQTNIFVIHCYNVSSNSGSSTTIIPHIEHIIEIPDGNYLSDVFVETLSNYFRNIGNGLQYLGLQINTITTKFEFYFGSMLDQYPYTPSNDFYIEIDFFPSQLSIPFTKTAGWLMGFRKNKYTITRNEFFVNKVDETTLTTYYGFLESESSYGSGFQQYIYFYLDEFQHKNRQNYGNTVIIPDKMDQNLGNNHILGRITVRSGQNTIIFDDESDLIFKRRNYFHAITLQGFHIKLLNKYGDVIDLNENDFSFALEVEILQ